MSSFNESTVELAAIEWLGQLGYEYQYGPDIAPEVPGAERAAFSEVVLVERLRVALEHLNPGASAQALEEALRQLTAPDLHPNLLQANRALHALIVGGVRVELPDDSGGTRAEHLRVIDFDQPQGNSFLAVNQFTVTEARVERRPDLVLFVNGLPLVVLEFKNTRDERATIEKAFDQLQTYQLQLTRLMAYNALLVISDGTGARLGVVGAPFERFQPWKTVTGREVLPESLGTLIQGALSPAVLLDLLRHFTVFEADGPELVKKVAAYHQYHAVLRAVHQTVEASRADGDRKGGVVWHTQGSGKSLSMVFYAGKLVVQPELANPTLVILTDRNDLDDQLFGIFSRCAELLRQQPEQVGSRAALRELLGARAAGGIVFTTIQKFMPGDRGDTFPTLSERSNVVVIADEAHRSQYGMKARVDQNTGQLSYGFAKHMRDALPNATFLGFTGTPVELRDADTRAVFGEYIDVYDVQRAVDDGATVPIFYESRLVRIRPDDAAWDTLDSEFEDITEGEEVASREKLKTKWAALEALVGDPKRVRLVAEDLVQHFEQRQEVIEGKGMIVGMSRRICVALYDEIIRLRPEWEGAGDTEGVIKVVMTGSATDDKSWQKHIRSGARNREIADQFRQADSSMRLVIVRDMWLTGFDVPSLHTMYIDKPMHGHNLMQAIARVNRVFRDKPGGLVVDYLGLANSLKEAMRVYTDDGRVEPKRDFEEALDLMQEKLDVVRGILHGFDYTDFAGATPAERVALIAAGQDFVLGKREAVKERYIREVLALGQAYALAIPHPDALAVREEIVFLQTVRAALSKQETTQTRQARHEVNHAIQQLVEKAVAPDGVIDVFASAGLKRPDISILSESFLQEVRDMPQRNLAVDLLEKLLRDEVRTRSRRNVVQSQNFSAKLEDAIARYQSRSIETAQVIEELLDLARQMREAQRRGDDLRLSEDEIAFYDALEVNDSAVKIMGDDVLREIAHEIAETVRRNATVDWHLREQARAKLRLMVKKVLRRHGYPPDKTEKASQLVLDQAELFAGQVT
ncbi:type I restriction endonuclease subunit R [Deinococcus planocerae]|uniref:type I restriction endonuclease subunit R n=1 Tax=Deinococcus planocerae TaxID=1737569 RepID=UPI000C7F335F|nr:type I restriction endonuclease subunit R [Deinococcus planocerae]